MTDIDSTAQRIVDQINAGKTAEAAEALDQAFHSLGHGEFGKVIEAMEKQRNAEQTSVLQETNQSGLATVKVNDWTLYIPWQGDLFRSAQR